MRVEKIKSIKYNHTINILLSVKMWPYFSMTQSTMATNAMITMETRNHAQKFKPHFRPIIRRV